MNEENYIINIEKPNQIDKPIYDMICHHNSTGELFLPCDNPRNLQIGWVSESLNPWLVLSISHLKIRKRSRILDDLGFGTELLFTTAGRKIVSEIFTNKDYNQYISMPNLKNILIMNEALS